MSFPHILTWDDLAHLVGRGPYKLPSSDDVPNLTSGVSGWTDGGTLVYLTTATDQVSVGAVGTAQTGKRLTIVNDATNTGIGVTALASGDNVLSGYVSGDTQNRIGITAAGTLSWGSGSAAADVSLARSAANTLTITADTVLPAVDGAVLGSAAARWDLHAAEYNANQTEVTTTYTVTTGDNVVLADTTGGSYTVTVPAISGNRQRQVTICKTTAANTLTIACTGGDTIQGAATYTINATGSIVLAAPETGTDWQVISSADLWAYASGVSYLRDTTSQAVLGASAGTASTVLTVTGNGTNPNGISVSTTGATATGIAVSTTGATAVPLTLTRDAAATNSIVPILTLARNTTGTAAVGIGGAILGTIEDDAGTAVNGMRIAMVATDVTAGSVDTDLRFNVALNGVLTEVFRTTAGAAITGAGDSTLSFGTASLRATLSSAVTHGVYAAAGDANASAALSSATLRFGAGGASALDTRIYRSTTKTIALDDNSGVNTELLVDLTASSTGTMINAYKKTVATNTVVPIITNVLGSSGVPASGLGASIDFSLANSTGYSTLSGRISCVVTTTTAGAENSDLRFVMQTGATAGTEKWRMQGSDGALIMMTDASIRPNTGGQGNIGTSSKQFTAVAAATYRTYAAGGDANASAALSSATLRFGAGGASALDVKLTRSGAATLQIDDNAGGAVTIVPAADNTGSIGTNLLRWALVRATTITSGFLGETEVFAEEDLDLDGKLATLRADMVQREFPEVPGENLRHHPRVTFVAARTLLEIADLVRAQAARIETLTQEVAALRG